MSNRLTNLIAIILLTIIFILSFFGIKGDSLTMDELAHIPAGYSYLTKADFRLNPEHPPLIKDLSAIPLLFLKINFPENHSSWKEGVNNQWWFGNQFLFHSGNDPDKIIFFSRISMILILILLGWLIFKFARELGGNFVGLTALTLFSFCPTFLAHGRLVTTDIGASLGVILTTYFWLKFLKNPSFKNIIFSGLTLGVALLSKFSLALLIPFFIIITFIFVLLKETDKYSAAFKFIGKGLIIAIIALLLIGVVYQFHILNYPPEKQIEDTKIILESSPSGFLKNLCLFMADKPGLRPFAHYLLGLLMVTQRAAGGNTVYFLGEISASGWWYYFPVVYFLKVPLAFHILTLIVLIFAIKAIKKDWLKNHFIEFSMLLFLAIYWFISIKGNLNIGIRHILPTFPFTYILVSLGIKKWLESISFKRFAFALVLVLLGWYIFSSLSTFPHYLTYFNEIAGGSKNGYKFVVDSNYDWGQDLKRLNNWLKKNNVSKIYLDYFGGADAPYYLREKYLPWQGDKSENELEKGSYLAVSADLLQVGKGKPVKGFNQPTGYYNWLNQYTPIARAGNSIFIYYIP